VDSDEDSAPQATAYEPNPQQENSKFHYENAAGDEDRTMSCHVLGDVLDLRSYHVPGGLTVCRRIVCVLCFGYCTSWPPPHAASLDEDLEGTVERGRSHARMDVRLVEIEGPNTVEVQ